MRLIDADAVAEAIKDEITEAKGIDADPNFTAGLKLGLAYINTAESIDAEPVRHGRWEPYEFGDDTWHKCSVCGTADKYINIVVRKGFADVRLVSKRNYCPICGAKMDEAEP